MSKTKELSTAAKICRVLTYIFIAIFLVTLFFLDKPVKYFDGLVMAEQTSMIKTFGRDRLIYFHEKADELYTEVVDKSGLYRKISRWFRPTEKELQLQKDVVSSSYRKAAEFILDASMRLVYILLLRWEVFITSLLFASVAFAVLAFRGYAMRSIINSNRNFPDHPLHKLALKLRPCFKWAILAWFLNLCPAVFVPYTPLLLLLGMCYFLFVGVAFIYKKY